jgi:hypothetical protein
MRTSKVTKSYMRLNPLMHGMRERLIALCGPGWYASGEPILKRGLGG